MRTKCYEVYKFAELSAAAQAKALDNLRDINVDYSNWADAVLEMWKEKLEAKGFSNPDISYSGFGSQGDGASFTAVIDLSKYELSPKYRRVRHFAEAIDLSFKNRPLIKPLLASQHRFNRNEL